MMLVMKETVLKGLKENMKKVFGFGFGFGLGFVNGELGAYSLQTESSKEGDGNLIEKGTQRERLSPS